MPFQPLKLIPGINTTATPLLNETGWSVSNLIRFFQGLVQKIGGWVRITNTALQGTCRALLAWMDLSTNVYVAAGTEQRLQLCYNGAIYDITPIAKTVNITPDYSTVLNSKTVTVTDVGHGAAATDGINIVNSISVGGLILQGTYEVQSVVDADNYTITAATSATSTVNNGGAAADFTTTNTSDSVQVTLNNHGLSASDIFTIYVATTVGGIALTAGPYVVQTVVDANNFTITGPGAATSSTSGFENAGNSRIQYFIPSGLASADTASGYGDGGYGSGSYGVGAASPVPTPLRQWSLGAWGQDLIAAPTGGSIYLWNPSLGLFENPAALMSANAPASVEGLFIAMPEQQIVTYGATDPNTGNPDPLLIRWCDVADFTDWTALATNQAGSFRLPRGSKIVGGLQGPQYGLLWTDLGLWAMQYVQPPLVYGFTELSEGCGLISMRCMGVAGTDVPWVSLNGFFIYSGGSVQPLPCPVWDQIFGNLSASQHDKMCLGVNSHFNEFFVFYPSASGNGENDSYVKCTKFNGSWSIWDYGSLVRTAWIDQSAFGNPLGVDGAGLIQEHENGYDADGESIIATATSGWFKLDAGETFVFLERLIPDFYFIGSPTLTITVDFADYPSQVVSSKNFTVTSSTKYIIIRSRSRLARIQISSTNDLGTFWRLGECLFNAVQAGSR